MRAAALGGGSGSLLRSGRGLRLGLGAVTRTTSGSASKGRGLSQTQKSTAAFNQPVQPVRQATCQKNKDNTGKRGMLVLSKTFTCMVASFLRVGCG